MTLNKLLIFAYRGAVAHEDDNPGECAEIRRFAQTWENLLYYDLEDIRLSEEDLREWDPSDNMGVKR